MTQFLIVGASAGAIGAVEGIRSLNPAGEITVVSEENLAPYSRPSISEYLDGRVSEESLFFGQLDFWAKNNVKTILGRRATELDLNSKKLQLDNGESLSFDKLLLTTGAKPIVPKMGGIEKDGFCTFSNVADINKILQKVPQASQSIVIGGGLIGVAAAEALSNVGSQVTIVELRGWLLNLLLDREAARIVETTMQSRGVRVITGQSVQEVVGETGNASKVGGVVLSGGERLLCSLVVAAIGVIPRTELAVQAGIKVNRGIVVNRYMETSVPDIYACGDVAEAYDSLNGTNQVLALWPLARLGGRVAGLNMAGDHVEYPGGFSMSALRYFDIPIVSVGATVQENKENEVLRKAKAKHYKKIVLRNGEVIGFTLVGDISSAGVLNNLLKTKANVSKFKTKLLDDNFGFMHLPEPLRQRTIMEAWA